MKKNQTKIFLIVCLLTCFSSTSFTQEQTGSIRGIVTDTEGNPLPGVKVTVSSEALMGTQTYETSEVGAFRFPALPPGTYTITSEISGFKSVTRSNIFVRVGMAVTINITMEMTSIKEDVTVTAASPVVDLKQSKISFNIGRGMLRDNPMSRDLFDIINLAPGAIPENAFRRTASIHGSTVRSNNYTLDGVSMNDPVVMYPITNVNFDIAEEVEIITGGHPAFSGFTDGAYINVVTRTGGNRFSGSGVLNYTNDDLSPSLWTDEQVQALGVSQPEADKSWIDSSLSLSGPLFADRLWFFTNARYLRQEKSVPYVPFTDILGHFHDKYDWEEEQKLAFLKLTSQLTSKIKLMGYFNFVDRYRPVYEEPGPKVNFIASRVMDHERTYTWNGILNFIIDQNTYFDIKVGYVRRWFPLYLQDQKSQDVVNIYDAAAIAPYLTTARFNETYLRTRFQTRVDIARFQDNFLGGNHEFKGGVEFEDTYSDWDAWKRENMRWAWFGGPYYYGDNWGLVGFLTIGTEQGSSKNIHKARKIGAYVQDSVTFANRLTLNVGLRYDRSWGWMPPQYKGESGNPLSLWIGENIVRPYVASQYPENFPDGINPWGELSSEEWKDVMVWNSFSPRIGLSFDVFGNGRTALKASFSRYTEYLMHQYFTVANPLRFLTISFYWVDTNFNQQIEQTDRFILQPYDFRVFDLEYSKLQIDPDAKTPYNDEIAVGISHELFRNFSMALNFYYKDKKNVLEDALYDPDTGDYWNTLDKAKAQEYWIPFRTTVPSEVYGDVDITFYVRKNVPDAPPYFYRLTTVPELKRKYWAFELVLMKRMSDGWSFAGAVVYSKAYGNIGASYGESWGYSAAGDNPNSFINAWGRTDMDRPLQIKLMGTAQLPYNIFLSARYVFFSGKPNGLGWVGIRPPESWATAMNAYRGFYTVLVEPQGKRRYRSWNNLDIRLEKEFWIGDAVRMGFYADIYNALGWSDITVGQDDLYRWQPEAEGFGQPGISTPSPLYKVVTEVSGRRTFKLSFRFSF